MANYSKGLTVDSATKISKMMEDVTVNNCANCFSTLVDLKQHMLDTEEYECLTDLKLLEDINECPIPFIVRE